MTVSTVSIAGRQIATGEPCFVIAEISANHGHSLDHTRRLIDLAVEAGADAVKIQTYTADSLTLDSDAEPFIVRNTGLWDGRRLHELYSEAATPWEWTGPLFEHAASVGIPLFSTPFDRAAVDFLEDFDPPAYKVASFELVDVALLEVVGQTRRPVILSTGMATRAEIDLAVLTLTQAGTTELVLLRCNSSYPAPSEEMDLITIPDMATTWNVPIGLSDHTLTTTAAIVAVSLGACVLEKHFTDSRDRPGPDSAFSLEPQELATTIDAVRQAHLTVGTLRYGPSPSESASLRFRRSLFVVADVEPGEMFTSENVRSVRPSDGLPPRLMPEVMGRRASRRIAAGTPLSLDLLAEGEP